jgi:hypothetical protein
MHWNGFAILFIPFLGLCAICRGGKWHWRVLDDTLSNAIFWFGWSAMLMVGILTICGVHPGP